MEVNFYSAIYIHIYFKNLDIQNDIFSCALSTSDETLSYSIVFLQQTWANASPRIFTFKPKYIEGEMMPRKG